MTTIPLAELDFSTGLTPDNQNGLLAGDFNRDGKLDLATTPGGAANPGICVLLGVGDGSFQPPKCSSALGTSEQDFMLAADFNADGNLDIAAVSTTSGHANVLLGNGDGTFESAIQLPVPINPFRGLAAGDFNRDGKLDLVVEQFDSMSGLVSFSVFLGNGDGTFSGPVVITPANLLDAFPIAVGDFNGDGKLDLVGTGVILLGNGDGTFQTPQVFGQLSVPGTPFAADVNGDGQLDLIASDYPIGDVSIYIGNGDGTFQNPLIFKESSTETYMAVGDLNADNHLDLITADDYSIFAYMLGNGDGTFQNIVTQPLNTQNVIQGIQLGDFNGDGTMDVAVRSQASPNDLAVLLQGQFPAASVAPNSLTFGPQAPGTSSSPQAITLKNSGTATMTITAIGISGTNAADFAQNNNCGASLTPN